MMGIDENAKRAEDKSSRAQAAAPQCTHHDVDVMRAPVESMTVDQIVHCVKVLRMTHDVIMRLHAHEVAQLRVELARARLDLAAVKFAEAQREQDSVRRGDTQKTDPAS